jgi:tRNA G18 (ribose-2'-O)-methylase SpoU
MYATVRCPNEKCSAVFDVAVERLGRNVYCLECGRRMTAKRTDIEASLRQREVDATGGGSADVVRLPLVVLVDNIRSLWNVGSIFRSADACAVEKILLCGITGAPPRKEISKTALGADEVVAWSYHADALDALEKARATGYTPVALESTETSTPLDDLSWPERPCLIIGNEVDGVSPRLLERCELRAAIPMGGVKESFNVAVAFGIAAHRASRALAPAHPNVRFR